VINYGLAHHIVYINNVKHIMFISSLFDYNKQDVSPKDQGISNYTEPDHFSCL